MERKDLKYLLAYIVPLSGFLAVAYAGYWSFLTVLIAFLVIPLIEYFGPVKPENLSEELIQQKKSKPFFSWLLYLNIPLVFGLVFFLFYRINDHDFSSIEFIGLIWSTGIVLGASGINVAHELGHKSSKLDQFLAKLLLIPSLYMHFYIEHNRGHHKNVGTPQDPATSRKGENLYSFWFRSVTQGYLHAWILERKRLQKTGSNFWSIQNQMILFHIIQLSFLAFIILIFNVNTALVAIGVAVISFLLLETINYIEHYGLIRKLKDNDQYEKVQVTHSWNSDHEIGRIMLYELVRHSDHHYKASREYQLLKHYDESPQLPFGYPGSMLISFIPPLWFRIMNKELKHWNKS